VAETKRRVGIGQKIDRLYAWVTLDPDGREGILAAKLPGAPGWTPLIGADKARIESYRQYAADTRLASGYPVKLKMFSKGTVIEVMQ
jgi:hypothetical protein